MIPQLVEMFKEFSENDEFAPAFAKIAAKIREALLAEGFSRAEAIEIIKQFSLNGN